ncbi:MAG TPA: L,D-transpeptidase family protein [Woeseiaceae bacterium]|nr:L,D-transpeptidase family protein [Woeseiaceae bacterium]
MINARRPTVAILAILAILATLGLLSGCTALDDLLADKRGTSEQNLPPPEQQPRLEPISRNHFVLETPEQSILGEPQIVFTRAEDTFADIAREYGLGYDELVDANPGVDPWLPGEGTPLLLPTQYVLPDAPRHGIVLNVAAKRLFYFPEVADGEPAEVLTYPIGIGRVGWETPVGEATVIAKAVDPVWYVPWSVQQEHAAAGDPLPAVVPPGPDNPLGHHVLQLDMPGYLIHGTNKPAGVGMRVSHGCVRLYPENIEELYSMVQTGEPVRIVDEPYLVGRRGGEIYLEAHRPLEEDPVGPGPRIDALLAAAPDNGAPSGDFRLRNHALAIASEALGIPVRLVKNDALEIYERARVVRNTVEPDPDGPTLAEVRALLDASPEEGAAEGEAPGAGGGRVPGPAGGAAEMNR